MLQLIIYEEFWRLVLKALKVIINKFETVKAVKLIELIVNIFYIIIFFRVKHF